MASAKESRPRPRIVTDNPPLLTPNSVLGRRGRPVWLSQAHGIQIRCTPLPNVLLSTLCKEEGKHGRGTEEKHR